MNVNYEQTIEVVVARGRSHGEPVKLSRNSKHPDLIFIKCDGHAIEFTLDSVREIKAAIDTICACQVSNSLTGVKVVTK
jgi:hypothetical protein